jgi:protein TonB
MVIRKNPEANLKLQYKKLFELGMIASLCLMIALVVAFKRFETEKYEQKTVQIQMEVQEVPQTEQTKRPPPPSRPAIPVETENEDVPEDETIDNTEIDWEKMPDRPAPPEEEDESAQIFVAYDEAPEPIGGFAAIQANLKYPEIARKAGVEGRVFVKAAIDENGNVFRTEIIKSLGNNGCDEAAIEAIKKVKWIPAKQRDRAVKVWISIPVIFKLR